VPETSMRSLIDSETSPKTQRQPSMHDGLHLEHDRDAHLPAHLPAHVLLSDTLSYLSLILSCYRVLSTRYGVCSWPIPYRPLAHLPVLLTP
jgi:hypothetical protein